jgi:hypothetical protein
MIAKSILYFGVPSCVCCDAKCSKAWGINNRPKVQLSDNEDDYYFLADNELGQAPEQPGTWEGRDTKPTKPEDRLNKWCVRECERSDVAPEGIMVQPHDFSVRRYNIVRTRTGAGRYNS